MSCAAVPQALAADAPASNLQQSQARYSFEIPVQPLVSALNAFSDISGWQVGLQADLAADLQSAPVSGRLSPEQALTELLRGTGVGYRSAGQRSVVLVSGERAVNLQAITVTAARATGS
jgi:hemoglobin/transferrin/lactoferrin receptor protein